MSAILPEYLPHQPWYRDPLNHLFLGGIAVIMLSSAAITHGLSIDARTEIDFSIPHVPDRNPLFAGPIWDHYTEVTSFTPEAQHAQTSPLSPSEPDELAPPFPHRNRDKAVPAEVGGKKKSRRRRRRG